MPLQISRFKMPDLVGEVLSELEPLVRRSRLTVTTAIAGDLSPISSDRQKVKAVAGYRYSESLSWGKYIYVDDLVTTEEFRSQGFGRQLFAWLVKQAKARGCGQFHLDSGVQRFAAHRFYLASRMDIVAHHFSMKFR